MRNTSTLFFIVGVISGLVGLVAVFYGMLCPPHMHDKELGFWAGCSLLSFGGIIIILSSLNDRDSKIPD